MAKPVLIINGHDYAEYVEELVPSREDLDADGSGRDIQNGIMYRTRIAQKRKWNVKMLNLPQSIHMQLIDDIDPAFYQAITLDPKTGTQTTKTYYSSSVPFGAQRYDKDSGAPYYSGMTFSMTER